MPAEYKYSREYGLYFPTGTTAIAAGATRYFTYSVNNAAINQVQVVCPHAGMLSSLIGYSVNPPGVGESFTYTLMVNGVPTALTCQTAGAVATSSEDLVNAVAVARGDLLCIRIVTTGAAAQARHAAGLMVKRI